MCLTIPLQIIKTRPNHKALSDNNELLDSSLVQVQKGDWVLTQNNLIISKINPKEAKNILKLLPK